MLEIKMSHPRRRVNLARVKQVLKIAEKLLPKKTNLSLAFVDDAKMISVNELYTGRNGSTDILAFNLGERTDDEVWYGEILISLDRAAKQAAGRKISIVDEITRLLVHGVAHLAGYDHHERTEFKKMRRVEFDLLLKCLRG